MELYATISLNMGRLSAIAEQLCQHASGDVETDVQACRADSMEVMRDSRTDHELTRTPDLAAHAALKPLEPAAYQAGRFLDGNCGRPDNPLDLCPRKKLVLKPTGIHDQSAGESRRRRNGR